MKQFFGNKAVQIAIGILILVIILICVGAYWQKLKAMAAGNNPKKLPNNGSGIPEGWTPDGAAVKIHAAMAGAGTDEAAIWSALDGLSKDQLAAVYNSFNAMYFNEYSANLLEWFADDLSGDDLARAMNYFNGI